MNIQNVDVTEVILEEEELLNKLEFPSEHWEMIFINHDTITELIKIRIQRKKLV